MPDLEPPKDWSITETVDVLARVDFLGTQEGGREQPLFGRLSYRPNHNFFAADNRVMCMGELRMPEDHITYPGDTVECVVRLILHPDIAETMQAGRKWRIQEGSKLVANARVIEVKSRGRASS